ncbi:serine/threonine-protein kinase LMTK1 isoform X2 [Peromyscus leucopus]|uniref:serine/threonine-protein kinase LMTK1 isoform X2 n=1 Tax=Peromyscus leucopus TaxID=10041 RepID=UPI0010A0E531|nr:serine/threonine-protein kinase LMTK1 isoform X2 [Peromyscus leucopus]
MPIALPALAMSSSFFNPSFAFSSHFDPDGAPLSELSWSSSLAVVAVSFSGLFTVIVLMLACLCCKKGGIGFKEFENAEGDEYVADFSEQGSPAAAAQNGPDVYVLPLTEVSLPMAKQPGRSVQLLKSTDLGRHSLLYLKEIGHGWFGKVFLGEVHSGVSGTQVVVKELKASASVQEQMQFLEEAQPYRTLQHSNLLQCLAQCAEVTPYLLVMEFCPLGDLKGYLRSCRVTESMAPDPLTLQRMACEVACGVLHLHRHNYVHSDLALRNCLLTADLTVKVGDYGLSHCKYREDYLVTTDQLWVPLRWIAPELVDEVHGNLLVVDQTKTSNVWSLGVTIWELFELGAQPYPQHSDRQVLAYAVREQQLKLPKPQLQLTLSDRWYEVMQFCWLQPEQRPTAEEVHLLLSYLCAKGTTELEEEFERRWRSLRPGGGAGLGSGPTGPAVAAAELTAASSFPLLEQFTGDGFHVDSDDVLTVTETSHGLNFEYKWEAGCGAEAFPSPGGVSSPGSASRLQELCAPDSSPPGVVPVLSAHSPSVGSEYFIRLEGAVPAAGHDPDCAGCAPSPEAVTDQDNNSEDSTTTSLVMEPLLGHAPPVGGLWGPRDHHSCRRQEPPCPSRSPSPGTPMLPAEDIDWGVATFCPPFFDDPLSASPSGSPEAQASPSDEELEGEKTGKAAQCGHWSSNVSANNNSGSRDPESWDPGYVSSFTDSYRDECSSLEQTPRASPELGHPLSQEDPREFLPGLAAASPGPEPSHCFSLLPLCPAKGLAPASCLATRPWTEAAAGGGDNPQVEPKLAQEAESSAESQLPLPSVPSPSHEGAPLPSEEASAPDLLPAPPTPAAGSRVTVPMPALTLDSCGSSLGQEAPSSEDEDATEATSGVFTDLSSDGPHPEKPGITPALRCLQKQVGTPDSLDSLDIPSSASDGGCEVLSPLAAGPPAGQPRAVDSGYDTENYESPEFVLKEAHESSEPEAFGELASEGESPGPETLLSVSLGGLSKKNPYRDSAYFSDLDAESESTFGPEKCSGVQDSQKEQDLKSPPSSGHQSVQAFPGPEVPREDPDTSPRETLPPAQQPEEPLPEGRGPEPLGAQAPVEVQPVPSPSHSKCFLLTSVPLSSEGNGMEPQGPPGQLSGPAQLGRMGSPSTPRSPLCLALPGHAGALEGRPEDEEDSEDSDESDEELRCYSIQEPSEDSEEEPPAVPVVVAESQSARNLRSLLKMPSLLSEAFCEDLERKKKAVSFFDDVTVYLFDQESPTRETGEPFPSTKESLPTFLEGSPGSPSAPGLPRRADHLPDSSTPEQGSRFEWDDDFPPAPGKAAMVAALDPADPVLATPTTPAAPLSRFTVSPTPASRFSITHVSDSDAQSVGGPAASAGGRYTEA